MTTLTIDSAAEHYAEHVGADFYQGLVSFMTSVPVVLLAVEGLGQSV